MNVQSSKNRLFRHLSHLPGWHTSRRIVVIESDDWGSVRTTDQKSLERLSGRFPHILSDPYNRLDSLESNADLEALFDVLRSVRDKDGRPAMITANTVVANPDFRSIEENAFACYYFEPFTTTLDRYPGRDGVKELILQGMAENLYRPQLHGREHLNVNQWLKGLQQGNRELRAAFQYGMFGVNLTESHSMRHNMMAAFDFDSPDETGQLKEILGEGQRMFKAEFGFDSDSFAAPCYIWHDALHPHMVSLGLRYLQGLAFQFIPNPGGDRYRKKIRFTGKREAEGITHLVRNAFFEPSLSPDTDAVPHCLDRIGQAFRYKKPAIIGTHRVNYIGSIVEKNREANLQQLGHLLKAIMKKWPDAEFMTTDQLGRLITDH
jgi:hypothetical protein